MKKSNIILIGMPGAGKSTIGVILAKRIGYHFIDTDLIIQSQQESRLQEIIDHQGLVAFRKIEEETLLNLRTHQTVIATGGSVIYSKKKNKKLAETGYRIYLQVSLDALLERIADMGRRGLVMKKGQSFEQLYQQRTPLYQQAADLTIECDQLNAEQVAASIEATMTAKLQHFQP